MRPHAPNKQSFKALQCQPNARFLLNGALSMLGQKIKEVRKNNRLTQIEFGNMLGTSSGHISDVENGKKMPGGELLCRLCELFDVDANWLLKHGCESCETCSGTYSIQDLNAHRKMPDYAPIPIYRDQSLGHQDGLQDTTNPTSFVSVSKEWIQNVCMLSPDSLCMTVVDSDTMEPTLRPGDLALIDRSVTKPCREGIFVVQFGEITVIKRLQIVENKLRFFGDNAKYEPITIDLSAAEDIKTIGKVIMCLRRLQ
jgi:transcriptional regulator with XRE-family HTH domain